MCDVIDLDLERLRRSPLLRAVAAKCQRDANHVIRLLTANRFTLSKRERIEREIFENEIHLARLRSGPPDGAA